MRFVSVWFGTTRRFHCGLLQLLISLCLIGTSEEQKQIYCLYNFTASFKAVGCTTLDIKCPSANHIEIQNLTCGRSNVYLPLCDKRTPENCKAAFNCCKEYQSDEAVELPPIYLQWLRDYCNSKNTCSLPVDVVYQIVYTFDRYYCLVTFICQRGKTDSFGGPANVPPATNVVVKPSSTMSIVSNCDETTEASDKWAYGEHIQSTSGYSDSMKSSSNSVIWIALPATASFVVIIVITVILLWRWKRRNSNVSSAISAYKSKQCNPERTSNKYETIDIRTDKSKSKSETSVECRSKTVETEKVSNKEDEKAFYLELDSTSIYNSTKKRTLNEEKASEQPEDMIVNTTEQYQQSTSLYENTAINDAIKMKPSTNINDKEERSGGVLDTFLDAAEISATVQLEEDIQKTNPYFVLEKCDPYDHLHSQSNHTITDDSSYQIPQENEYNHINFAKPNIQMDPNYGVLKHEVSESSFNEDTYSHLHEENAIEKRKAIDYSHFDFNERVPRKEEL